MRRPQMTMPRRGGSPEAASKANFQLQVYTKIAKVKQLLRGALVAAFLGESLAFAVVIALAVFAVGGVR